MDRHLISLVLTFFVVLTLKSALGLKWVPVIFGDDLPDNVISVDENRTKGAFKYVGRVVYDNKISPAEIDRFGNAAVNGKYVSINGEILTYYEGEECRWIPYYYKDGYKYLDQNRVRGGVEENGDPIFIGRSYVGNGQKDITSIYLPNKQITQRWSHVDPDDHGEEQWQYLSCESNNTIWVDSSTTKLPTDAIAGGFTEEGYEIFVARLKKKDDNHIVGYVIPEKGAAVFETQTEDNDSLERETNENTESNETANSDKLQVLVGKYDYFWVSGKKGEIPDNAVVNGKIGLEITYVARFGKSLVGQITQTEARERKSKYEILVESKL